MFRIPVDAVFERGFKVLESACSHPCRPARCLQAREGRPKRHRECLGDPFGKLPRKITLPDRRIVAGVEIVHRRK